jgi:hypothetical protein
MKMKLLALLAIPFPPLLDEIILKIVMHIVVSNGMVGGNKACHPFIKQFDSHSKMAPKVVFGKNGRLHEVAPH